MYAYSNPTVYIDLNGYEATPWFNWTVNDETDVLETKGQTYDTGSDIKDAFYATSDSITNFGKVAFNDAMALSTSPEYGWAKLKGGVTGSHVSLDEASGDFDATIGALPMLSVARPSNVPRVLRRLLGKESRLATRIVENSRGPLKAAGEIDDLPPMPKREAVKTTASGAGHSHSIAADTNAGRAKRPGGYVAGDVDEHGLLSPQVNRAVGNTNTKPDYFVQSHHPIQDKWAKVNVPGYDRNKAPAILLESSSEKPHARISAAQRARRREMKQNDIDPWSTSIRQEFDTGYSEMLQGGVSESQARKAIKDSYKYFDMLGAFDK